MKPHTLSALSITLFAAGCSPEYEGTFVGNPNLTVGYADSAEQFGRGGRLEVAALTVLACKGKDVALGAASFPFEGTDSTAAVQVPVGSWCGLKLRIDELLVRYDAGDADSTTVTARDFSLSIPEPFDADEGDSLRLRLADARWLDDMAAVAVAGENLVGQGNPGLEQAFFGGLRDRSGIERSQGTGATSTLPGRLNLDGYPFSPSGTPTSQSGCGPDVTYNLAVPIPHAAMATLGVGDGEVGWCEGSVLFNSDLNEQSATQVDYSDFSTYSVQYNGWGEDCGDLHCNDVFDHQGAPVDRRCTVLAFCDGNGTATVTGFTW